MPFPICVDLFMSCRLTLTQKLPRTKHNASYHDLTTIKKKIIIYLRNVKPFAFVLVSDDIHAFPPITQTHPNTQLNTTYHHPPESRLRV